MQDYLSIKSDLLDIVKGTHTEKVLVHPKDSKIKPYYRTVRKRDDDDESKQRVKKQEDDNQKHNKRQEKPRRAKEDDKTARSKSNIEISSDSKLDDEEKSELNTKVNSILEKIKSDIQRHRKSSSKKALDLKTSAQVTSIDTDKYTAQIQIEGKLTEKGFKHFAETSLGVSPDNVKVEKSKKGTKCTLNYEGTGWRNNIDSKRLKEREAEIQKREKAVQKREEAIGLEPRNYDSKFCKTVGKEHYDAIRNIIDDSRYTSAKLYAKALDNLDARFKSDTERCCYTHGNGTLWMGSMEQDAKGNSYSTPYSSIFHESGHSIDFDNGTTVTASSSGFKVKIPYSAMYKDGAFVKAIHEDVGKLFTRISGGKVDINNISEARREILDKLSNEWENGTLKADWYVKNNLIPERVKSKLQKDFDTFQQHLEKDDELTDEDYETMGEWVPRMVSYYLTQKGLTPGNDINDAHSKFMEEAFASNDAREYAHLSDIVEGATGGYIQTGYGHGSDYWTKQDGIEVNLATEAFSEMMEAELTNPKSVTHLKKYLPSAYKVYQEMVESLAKGGTSNGK